MRGSGTKLEYSQHFLVDLKVFRFLRGYSILFALGCYQYPRFMGKGLAYRPTSMYLCWKYVPFGTVDEDSPYAAILV